MASITLKNIPVELLNELRETAKSNQRSLNSEALHALKVYLLMSSGKPNDEDVIRKARALRQEIKGSLTLEEIAAAINSGRP
jgi:plasmid stability protein